MSAFTLRAEVALAYDEAVTATRSALADQGFGILTEIDLAATMKTKLGVDLAPQIILGACRPALAYEAISQEPAIAAVLPCNVVVRADGDTRSIVEAFDPNAMMSLASVSALETVATDARTRITAALQALANAHPQEQ